jgi:putative acetyltransferase
MDFVFRDARRDDSRAVFGIVDSVLREYGLQSDPRGTDADLADLEASYQQRAGVFRVIESSDKTIVGCGGLFPVDSGTVELRKMYLLAEARGRGLGKKLLAELLDEARRLGYKRVVLETNSVLKEAIGLYRKFGFEPVARAHRARRCDQAWELWLSSQGDQGKVTG